MALENSKSQKTKPLSGLTKKELEQELASRQIFENGNKTDLQNLLNKEMCRKQGIPALLFNNPAQNLSEFGLADYEILPCEPLHDVGHHIANIFTELPHHLEEKESKAMQWSLELCLESKDRKLTADYRSALLKTAGYLLQSSIMCNKPISIINTLGYHHHYNQSWLHSILLKELIEKPKKLTRQKWFGAYFYSLSAHAGIMLCLISGQASNAE